MRSTRCPGRTDGKAGKQRGNKNYGIANQHGIFPVQHRTRVIHDRYTNRPDRHRNADIFMMKVCTNNSGQCESESNSQPFTEVITIYEAAVCCAIVHFSG